METHGKWKGGLMSCEWNWCVQYVYLVEVLYFTSVLYQIRKKSRKLEEKRKKSKMLGEKEKCEVEQGVIC